MKMDEVLTAVVVVLSIFLWITFIIRFLLNF